MLRLPRSLHAALVAMTMSSAMIAPIAAHAADMPAKTIPSQDQAVLSAADYLDLEAMLMQLRVRFGAALPDEAEAALADAVAQVGEDAPGMALVERLSTSLTSEIAYFAVNLKYLILAEGAIWPDDKPARTYRLDALSELDAVIAELFGGSVFDLDVDSVLHRLEAINAWTEGAKEPPADWFSAKQRQDLIEQAREAQKPAQANT